MEQYGKFLLFIGYISRRTYVRKRARVERQDCVARSEESWVGMGTETDGERRGEARTDDT